MTAGDEGQGVLDRDVDQDGLGNDLVHQAELARLRGPDRVPGQDEVEGGLDADEPRQPLGAAGAREEAELHLGEPELGPGRVRGHPAPAGQRPFQAPAEAGPVDGGDHRLGEEGESIEPVLSLAGGLLAVGDGAEGAEPLHVRADDEVLLRRGEDDGLHRLVASEPLQLLAELGPHRRGERVHRLTGKIEGDHRHLAPHLGPEGSHQTRSRTMAAPSPPAAQTVQSAVRLSRRASASSACITMRAPVAQKG